jgi:hypothetical protein
LKDDNPSLDGTHTGRLKRKIPAVTEVLDELASTLKTDPYGKGQLFDAAQRVCTEEIRRLKLEGGEPASLWLLVERARDLLDPSRRSRGESAAVSAAPFDEEPFDLTAPPAPNPNFVLPRPGEADPIVFEPPPPVPARPAPPPRERGTAIPPITPGSAPRVSRAAAPALFSNAPQRHPALRVFFLIVAAGALLGGGYYYYRLRERPAAPSVAPRGKPARRPLPRVVAPAPAAPAVSASPSAPVPASPSQAPGQAPAPPTRTEAARAADETSSRQVEAPSQSRPGTMVSAEWAGKQAVYMLHFSSYKSRDNADRDAGRLTARLGQPAHVLQVDLGREGVWYRVMVGEFPTAEEAFAFRAELAARKTPDVGLVFKVTGPRG